MTSGLARIVAGLGVLVTINCIADIRVNDDLGREIHLDAPARRIVSLAPHNTENLFSAGAGSWIVGTVDHSDFPEQALEIPRVGSYPQINFEAILELKPDLVVAWSSGNLDQSVSRLTEMGIPVFYSEPTRLEDIISNIERLAILSGQSAQAAPQLVTMRKNLNELELTYASRTPVRVFYQVWNEPLITLNGQHSVSRAIDICGGTNVFADQPTIAPRINVEGVIARDPQIMLLAGHSQAKTEGWMRSWEKWVAIAAVANQQLRYVNPDIVNRPTQRFFDASRNICELIDAARQQLKQQHGTD